jgi:ligand-binding SRPBCC domain-containing protein
MDASIWKRRRTYSFDTELWLPIPREELFHFFADARNLQEITPPWLRFEVLNRGPIEMKPGTRIDYRLCLHGIPLRWQSEITTWEPPYRFVDQQRRGPYPFWVHEHTFLEQYGGTLARDHVEYGVPGGSVVNRLLVRPDLEKIFKYRHQRLDAVFRKREHGTGV